MCMLSAGRPRSLCRRMVRGSSVGPVGCCWWRRCGCRVWRTWRGLPGRPGGAAVSVRALWACAVGSDGVPAGQHARAGRPEGTAGDPPSARGGTRAGVETGRAGRSRRRWRVDPVGPGRHGRGRALGEGTAAPTWKRSFGFHPLCSFIDHGAAGTGEGAVLHLRKGNARSNTAGDHITLTRTALAQIPADLHRQVLVRTDSGGGTHEFLAWWRAGVCTTRSGST